MVAARPVALLTRSLRASGIALRRADFPVECLIRASVRSKRRYSRQSAPFARLAPVESLIMEDA